jgi:hypothetical protein
MSGCVLWKGRRSPNGYGRVGDGGYAHRAAYEAVHGAIPNGFHLHHTCGVKACVNPEHLEALTAEQHASRHAPTHCKHGHEFTPENTYHYDRRPWPMRGCRTCRRAAVHRYKRRQRDRTS